MRQKQLVAAWPFSSPNLTFMLRVASSSVHVDQKRHVEFEMQIKYFKGNEKNLSMFPTNLMTGNRKKKRPLVSRIEWELQDNVHQATWLQH
jgi:hypothetical protein